MLTKDLSFEERLFMERFRLGQSQRDAAKRYKVSLKNYRAWEMGEGREDNRPKNPTLGRLLQNEVFVLRRRREGIKSQAICNKIEVSRWWLRRMEVGDAPIGRLVEFWEGFDKKKRKKSTKKAG